MLLIVLSHFEHAVQVVLLTKILHLRRLIAYCLSQFAQDQLHEERRNIGPDFAKHVKVVEQGAVLVDARVQLLQQVVDEVVVELDPLVEKTA